MLPINDELQLGIFDETEEMVVECKWYYTEFERSGTNGECPYCGDWCPTSEFPEVCKYADKAPVPLQLSALLGRATNSNDQLLPKLRG